MTELDILRAEHALLDQANNEWLGMDDNRAGEDVSYISGVIDMTNELLKEFTNDETSNCGLTTEP